MFVSKRQEACLVVILSFFQHEIPEEIPISLSLLFQESDNKIERKKVCLYNISVILVTMSVHNPWLY